MIHNLSVMIHSSLGRNTKNFIRLQTKVTLMIAGYDHLLTSSPYNKHIHLNTQVHLYLSSI